MVTPAARRARMDYAFILDPLPDLKAYKDSSVSMMRSLAARGHAIFALQPSDVFWDASGTRARATPLVLNAGRQRLV
jgi:glutathione synthase